MWPGALGEPSVGELQEKWRSGLHPSGQCLTVQPDGRLVLRPRWRLIQWNGLPPGTGSLIMMAVMTLILLAFVPGAVIILVPLACIFTAQCIRGAAILTASDLIIRTWYGRPRALPRSRVARVAVLQVEQKNRRYGDGEPYPLLLAVDETGRCLRRLVAVGISYAETLAFAAALLVPVDTLDHPVRLNASLARQFRGSVPWWAEYKAVTAVLLTAAVLLAIVLTPLIYIWAGA